jgi:adenylate cyclase
MHRGSSEPTEHGSPASVSPLSRRLATVVFVDVVGYTKLMELDEAGTHQRWMALRQGEIEPRVTEKNGAVVKSTGDGLLLEFPSARGAIGFALDVQRRLASRREGEETAALQIRMAANIVDVIPEQDDIYGDGVNIAARLLAFADPGGVVISASLEEQVRGRLDYRTADLGFLTVKNVERRIRAFKITPAELAPPKAPPGRHHKPSIAVLPLQVLSGDQSDSYRSAGLIHEIVASLAGLRELFVVSNRSTAAFTETNLDPSAICNQLGVRYLLAGSLIRGNGRLKVRFELSDNDVRTVIWTDQHELPASDLFGLQAEIASKVAYALLPHIRSQELQKALRKRPENLDSYDLTLRALYRLYRLGAEDFKISKQLLESAIEHDPHNAMAYALMAKWYILRIGEGHSADFKADSQSALDFASRALEYDASDPLALAIFGHVRSFLFADYERAIEAFDRAILASPNSAIAWGLSAPTYCYIGDGKQGVMRAAHAMALSPLDPYAYFYRAAHCLSNYVDDNFEEAVAWGRRTMAAAPTYTASMRPLIASLVALERMTEAQEVAGTMMRLDPAFRVEQFCSWYPIKDPERRALFERRLLGAGLPA